VFKTNELGRRGTIIVRKGSFFYQSTYQN